MPTGLLSLALAGHLIFSLLELASPILIRH